MEYWRITRGSGYGDPFVTGEVIRSPKHIIDQGGPEFLYVVKTKSEYISEDGLSFGVGDEEGYLYIAECREATKEEAENIIKKELKIAETKKAKNELKEIKNYIQQNGERPKGWHAPEGKSMFNTQNIYGSGDWFIIDENYIWYIMNNGMDGDNWSLNNIKTGGAGAIGWRIKKDIKIVKKLEKINSCLK